MSGKDAARQTVRVRLSEAQILSSYIHPLAMARISAQQHGILGDYRSWRDVNGDLIYEFLVESDAKPGARR